MLGMGALCLWAEFWIWEAASAEASYGGREGECSDAAVQSSGAWREGRRTR